MIYSVAASAHAYHRGVPDACSPFYEPLAGRDNLVCHFDLCALQYPFDVLIVYADVGTQDEENTDCISSLMSGFGAAVSHQ
jgi:hypothetical protein